ncbi:MAG TPA: undecaprenyl-phosphate glucose phosphotransferase [Halothiobacillus sp.]|nr:undecaprenyl-phosphate glucose phosphotransferase [Halothiobacillus sp.]HQS29785.1 undecaprenyl-phosphate glucose phosphotransferase [Halothiobacillus sp.]
MLNRTALRSHGLLIAWFSRLMDVGLVVVAGLLVFAWRFGWAAGSLPVAYGTLLVLGGLLVLVVFPLFGVYDSWRARGLASPALRVLSAWLLVFVALLIGLVLAKEAETFSRLWLAQWGLLGGGALVASRLGVYFLLRRLRQRGLNYHSAVVVGCGALARDLIARATTERWAGFKVVAVFCSNPPDSMLPEHEVAPLDALLAYVSNHPVDEVWIAVPLDQSLQLKSVLEKLRFSTANVRFVPDLFGLFLINHGISQVMNVPMIDLTASPMTGANRIVKGVEDRVLALLIILLVSPLLMVIALGVKFSSKGAVLYKQKRHGWDGQPFNIYKFRSMRHQADDEGEVPQAVKGDSRVTRFGAFLRRTSLDELPQFINVLQGRMSIVGPRPHAVEHNEFYKSQIDGYMLRHKVKPGITGWAQINGWRGETDTLEKMQKRVEYDLYYIEHWSLMFDLKIILLTIFRGFVHKNAY